MAVKVKPRAAKKTPLKLKSKAAVKPKLSSTPLKPAKEAYIPTKKKVTPLHVAIAGNIGAGKTTLTNLLAKNLKWEPHFETVDDNPYLNDFYDDMQRWSFNLQVYFLNSRFTQVTEIRKNKKTVIQDRTIYEDAYIFAPNLHAMGLMTTKDFENYFSLFTLMNGFIQAPDL